MKDKIVTIILDIFSILIVVAAFVAVICGVVTIWGLFIALMLCGFYFGVIRGCHDER